MNKAYLSILVDALDSAQENKTCALEGPWQGCDTDDIITEIVVELNIKD